MHSLPIFLDLRGRPIMLVGTGDAAAAKRRLIERAGGLVVGEDHPGARIGFITLDDAAEAEAAAARLRERGVIINVADRPALCDFTLPAIVDRDPLLVAVATGGASAGLAKAVRQRIEALLPAGIGRLADALGQARGALRARFPDAADRRAAIDAALAEGGPLDPLADHGADAVARWLASAETLSETRLVTIRLASPDPDDLTLAAARLLGRADRVYHRADVPAAILDRARADATRIACDAAPAIPGPGLSLDLSL